VEVLPGRTGGLGSNNDRLCRYIAVAAAAPHPVLLMTATVLSIAHRTASSPLIRAITTSTA
jgi:hypothetical protein